MIPVAADANWFYSTLAQSTAALVGLAGAFLLQRLLVQREEVSVLRRQIREDVLELSRHIRQEEELARSQWDGIETAIREGHEEAPDSGVISAAVSVYVLGPDGSASGQVGLPEFPRDAGFTILNDALTSLKQYVAALESIDFLSLTEDLRVSGHLRPPDPNWLQDGKSQSGEQVTDPRSIWVRLETQHQAVTSRWRKFRDESKNLGARLGSLKARLVPRTFYVLFAILLLLLAAGVLAPLVFLSAEDGPSKWILLGLFGPLSAAFVGFFGWELRSLRRADRLEKVTF